MLREINPIKRALIKICTGYVNTLLKDELRNVGFSVEVAEIGEPLQSALELQHKTYLKKNMAMAAIMIQSTN